MKEGCTFFSRLKGKFTAKFQGRYLAHILDEVFCEDPRLLMLLIGAGKKLLSAKAEVSFRIEDRKRK